MTRKIAWFKTSTGTWEVSTTGRAANGAIYDPVDDASAMIIVEEPSSNSASYLDAGNVYSTITTAYILGILRTE